VTPNPALPALRCPPEASLPSSSPPAPAAGSRAEITRCRLCGALFTYRDRTFELSRLCPVCDYRLRLRHWERQGIWWRDIYVRTWLSSEWEIR